MDVHYFVLVAVCSLTFAVFRNCQCSLISQSIIEGCDWGDDTEPGGPNGTCTDKMVVSMALKTGQVLPLNDKHSFAIIYA